MKQHDQGADANVVGTVGETEQEDGSQMVDHLLFKILANQTYVEYLSFVCQKMNLKYCSYSHLLTMC